MRKAATTTETGSITLARLQDEVVEIQIQGLTPVIPHKWSEKSKSMMPGHPNAPSLKEKKGKREPEKEAEACVYRLPDGRPGLPATAFKAAMVSGCRFFDGKLTMVQAKVLFHVEGEGPDQLVPFEGTPRLREDTPRNATGGADLRYRTEFSDWKATIRIRYVKGSIEEASIVALLDAGGRGGVGDWRPSAPKSATGTYGTFRVVGMETELETTEAQP